MNIYKKLLLGLIIGIMSVKWWRFVPELIPSTFMLLLISILLFLLSVKSKKYFPFYFIGIALGAYISLLTVHLFEHKTNLALSVGVNTTIAGEVGSLYSENKRLKRIIFDIDTVNGKEIAPFGFRISVFSSNKYVFKEGERWQLKVRLREPYGRSNIAGFDARTYYLANHIHGKGTLLEAKLITPHLSMRQSFLDTLLPVFRDYPQGRFLLALAFGKRNLLTEEDWLQLKQTGLTHLLAISGLHIGLAYGFAFFVLFHLLPIFSKRDKFVAVPYVIACFFAVLYAWAAGFSLPTQRALVALLLWVLLRLSSFKLSGSDAFLIVLACILLFEPFSVFSMSFWLSFSAVGVIVIFQSFSFLPLLEKNNALEEREFFIKNSVLDKGRAGFYLVFHVVKKAMQTLFILQFFLLLGMLPLNLYYFGGVSVSALFANSIAIPIISFITVPSLLLAFVFSFFYPNNFAWWIADISLSWIMSVAHFLSQAWIRLPSFSLLFIFTLLSFIMLFILVSKKQKGVLAFTGLILLFTWKDEKGKTEAIWNMHVLDVGHGLAVLIESEGEALLYDTGASWGKSSIAQSVIQPVLDKLDLSLTGVMISHMDNDHAGGLTWIETQLNPEWIRSSSQSASHLSCQKGDVWRWKHLQFSVLSPSRAQIRPKNADSCVVKVFDGVNSVLLTGDIPKKEEAILLNMPTLLKSDVLLVPHHGSLSSSSLAFLEKVNPHVAIASTGRYTPWQLPHPDVITRYEKREIGWFETSTNGQISVTFSEKGINVSRYRQDVAPYWYRKVVGAL